MSMVIGPLFAFIYAFILIFVVVESGLVGPQTPDALALIVLAGALILGFLIHWFTPVPDHNGGFGMPPAQKQQWGFTTEPADEQPDPDGGEVLSWRPGLLGIYWASNQPQEDDGE